MITLQSQEQYLDPSQMRALEQLYSRKNIFLTGNAGTGKTTVITEYLTHASDVAVTATTGIAALNLRSQIKANIDEDRDAMTVYRWAGIGIGPYNNSYQGYETNKECLDRLLKEMKYPPFKFTRPKAMERICDVKTLIIDEISMLPGKTLSFLDCWFRFCRNQNVPFGGIQMIVVGDFLQLPPVAKTGLYDWCFMSKAWIDGKFEPLVLTRIHRQDDDGFKAVLNGVREGKISRQVAATLQSRVAVFPSEKIIRLYTHNSQVDKFNNMRLNMIEQPVVVSKLRKSQDNDGCKWIASNLTSPERLEIKIGARVMVTVNLSNEVVNGTIGTVTEINKTYAFDPLPSEESPFAHIVTIVTDDGIEQDIGCYTWQVTPGEPRNGEVYQLPLRLAWATTIHKSQGLSLDSALIDARAAREPGQTYVALSRVRTLQGLHLKDTFNGVFVSPDAVKFTNNICNTHAS